MGWLVPFKGRNDSGKWNTNFVWKSANVYIMDNHRAAAWCWADTIQRSQKYSLFHIDRHMDTLSANLHSWVEEAPDLWNVSIDEYLNREFQATHCSYPLFSYDNYLSMFLRKYSSLVTHSAFATHNEGDRVDCPHAVDYDLWDIPGNLGYWLDQREEPWILNLDLDYFVCWLTDEKVARLVHDEYIAAITNAVYERLTNGRIAVLTIALSPEHCGGWPLAEELCQVVCAGLDIDFELPK